MKKLIAIALLFASNAFADEYPRTEELSYHGFVLIEVVAVAKDCWRNYGKPAGKNLAKNLKGVYESCKDGFDLSYHPDAKALPGEELNCFYLDVLEALIYFDPPREVYHKEIDGIHQEWFDGPHVIKCAMATTDW